MYNRFFFFWKHRNSFYYSIKERLHIISRISALSQECLSDRLSITRIHGKEKMFVLSPD
jgi:hypothetical protein